MNSRLLDSGVDWLGVVVPRDHVKRLDIGHTLETLNRVLDNRETVIFFQGRVDIAFEGWDADPREIYEIPEIRTFLHLVDEGWPYWLYFLSPDLQTLRMVTFSICHAKRVGPGKAHVPSAVLGSFLMERFAAVNDLIETFQLNEAVNEQISARIGDYFMG